ncbi:uncharacterized protein [Solanum lycopersicum]|uniref:uncharacterized protein n=1 Tax=Solanum lycopersicum TaxID=4081 RepID=UPI0037482705
MDNKPLRGGPVNWEVFKKAFVDWFFPRDKREAKVVEFINLLQGGMSVHEHFLKFTKLSKYALSWVSNPRDEMRNFVMGLSDDLQEECHSAMIHENMNISRLVVHSQLVKETRAKRKSRAVKKATSFDGVSSKGSVEIQDNPRFNKRVSNKVPYMFPKSRDYRVSNPRPKKGKGTSSPIEKPTCGKCGKKHYVDCIKGMDNYFVCCKIG